MKANKTSKVVKLQIVKRTYVGSRRANDIVKDLIRVHN